jgi:hypothetical protein
MRKNKRRSKEREVKGESNKTHPKRLNSLISFILMKPDSQQTVEP